MSALRYFWLQDDTCLAAKSWIYSIWLLLKQGCKSHVWIKIFLNFRIPLTQASKRFAEKSLSNEYKHLRLEFEWHTENGIVKIREHGAFWDLNNAFLGRRKESSSEIYIDRTKEFFQRHNTSSASRESANIFFIFISTIIHWIISLFHLSQICWKFKH